MIRVVFAIAALGLSACTTVTEKTHPGASSNCDDIWTVNTVSVQPERLTEAKLYYEAAWLPARAIAKNEGAIKDYQLLHSKKAGEPEFQLVTIYEDDAQFAAAEDEFQAIFRRLELPRPLLINGLERSQIIADTIGADDYRFLRSSAGPC